MTRMLGDRMSTYSSQELIVAWVRRSRGIKASRSIVAGSWRRFVITLDLDVAGKEGHLGLVLSSSEMEVCEGLGQLDGCDLKIKCKSFVYVYV